jgi:hypothetical protein
VAVRVRASWELFRILGIWVEEKTSQFSRIAILFFRVSEGWLGGGVGARCLREGSGPGSGIGVLGETGWAVGVGAWPWRNTLQGIWGLASPGRGGFERVVVWVRVSWGTGQLGSRLR